MYPSVEVVAGVSKWRWPELSNDASDEVLGSDWTMLRRHLCRSSHRILFCSLFRFGHRMVTVGGTALPRVLRDADEVLRFLLVKVSAACYFCSSSSMENTPCSSSAFSRPLLPPDRVRLSLPFTEDFAPRIAVVSPRPERVTSAGLSY